MPNLNRFARPSRRGQSEGQKKCSILPLPLSGEAEGEAGLGERVGVRGMATEHNARRRASLAINRERARAMRRKPVELEKLFWSEVRNRKLGGYKFKRQYLIGRYIVNFVCIEKKLIVELDGPFHPMRQAYDEERDTYLNSQGYRVLRFPNSYAADDIGIVLLTVKNALDTATPSP
ncbi:MAG: DUF559 domain-containing protein [Rhizomicrobium sp.]